MARLKIYLGRWTSLYRLFLRSTRELPEFWSTNSLGHWAWNPQYLNIQIIIWLKSMICFELVSVIESQRWFKEQTGVWDLPNQRSQTPSEMHIWAPTPLARARDSVRGGMQLFFGAKQRRGDKVRWGLAVSTPEAMSPQSMTQRCGIHRGNLQETNTYWYEHPLQSLHRVQTGKNTWISIAVIPFVQKNTVEYVSKVGRFCCTDPGQDHHRWIAWHVVASRSEGPGFFYQLLRGLTVALKTGCYDVLLLCYPLVN